MNPDLHRYLDGTMQDETERQAFRDALAVDRDLAIEYADMVALRQLAATAVAPPVPPALGEALFSTMFPPPPAAPARRGLPPGWMASITVAIGLSVGWLATIVGGERGEESGLQRHAAAETSVGVRSRTRQAPTQSVLSVDRRSRIGAGGTSPTSTDAAAQPSVASSSHETRRSVRVNRQPASSQTPVERSQLWTRIDGTGRGPHSQTPAVLSPVVLPAMEEFTPLPLADDGTAAIFNPMTIENDWNADGAFDVEAVPATSSVPPVDLAVTSFIGTADARPLEDIGVTLGVPITPSFATGAVVGQVGGRWHAGMLVRWTFLPETSVRPMALGAVGYDGTSVVTKVGAGLAWHLGPGLSAVVAAEGIMQASTFRPGIAVGIRIEP